MKFNTIRTYAVGHGYYISVPPAGDWAGTRPAPTLGLFPVGATLVVALDSEARKS